MHTLEEVARISNTSRSTVSRVINQDPHVSQATRQRVLEIINQLDFQPNRAARRLAGGRTYILGLVIPTGVSAVFSDPYFPMLIRGISSTCQDMDHSVMLWLAEAEFERRTLMQVMQNGFIDGVIVSSMPIDEAIIEVLDHSDLPFVQVGRSPVHSRISFVDVENQSGAASAVTHLLKLGRRKIAHISGPLNTVVGLDRRQGYREALQGRGISPDPELFQEGDFSEESGYRSMQLLLPHRPDAVFASSDAMAFGALRAMRESGIRVPQDIAIIGFDDLPFSAHSEPPLTTVHQPIQETGRLAVQTLVNRIEQPHCPPVHIFLSTELVIRQSCGSSLT